MEPVFTPSVWPEAETPPDAVGCMNCELYRQRSRIIWGEGNPEAPILVVLDNPGAREDREGNPFVCGTRQTLQLAAFTAGFVPGDLFVTYILKCRPVRSYDKQAARSACLAHLPGQIERQRPRLAMCLGDTAVQWFFEDAGRSVKGTRGTWRDARGIPTVASYHPLAVRRRPNLFPQFQADWNMLAERLFAEQRNLFRGS